EAEAGQIIVARRRDGARRLAGAAAQALLLLRHAHARVDLAAAPARGSRARTHENGAPNSAPTLNETHGSHGGALMHRPGRRRDRRHFQWLNQCWLGRRPPIVMTAVGARAIAQRMGRPPLTDYEKYIRTEGLLSLQKTAAELSCHDELQFQIVHQVA